MAPVEVQEIRPEFQQRTQAHSEILEDLVAESIELKKRIESIEECRPGWIKSDGGCQA